MAASSEKYSIRLPDSLVAAFDAVLEKVGVARTPAIQLLMLGYLRRYGTADQAEGAERSLSAATLRKEALLEAAPQQDSPTPAPAPGEGAGGLTGLDPDKVRAWRKLVDEGALTEEEFAKIKGLMITAAEKELRE